MRVFEHRSSLLLSRPRVEIFEFFANAMNIEVITPPWLSFRVISRMPIEIREGAEIEYRLKIRGFPVRWRSRIRAWEPPRRFVDEQIHGPYRLWLHEHLFSEEPSGTLCQDHVQYAHFGGIAVNKLMVARDVEKIFAYRSSRLLHIFNS